MKQKTLQENMTDRVYFTSAYDWKTRTTGKAIIFPKPWTEKPFQKQKIQRVLTIEQYNKEYNKTIPTNKWKPEH